MKYEFIGWERDEKENVDKVWGVICISEPDDEFAWDPGKYVSFWGRRGKKLSTKIYDINRFQMRKVWEKKEKTYTKIEESKLHTVYPEFRDDLEKTAVWALLSN
jgi:hypothetical protein